jgi:DNA-directed RNA polymerase subunit L
LRIQTDGSQTPKDALLKGLDDLELVLQHIHDEFKIKIKERDYSILEGADPDHE